MKPDPIAGLLRDSNSSIRINELDNIFLTNFTRLVNELLFVCIFNIVSNFENSKLF